jgi:hypothetical protein
MPGATLAVLGRNGVGKTWHAGPGIEPAEDPDELGPKVAELIKQARTNADIWGRDIVS